MANGRSTDSFYATGRSLEDAFFEEQDRRLIARRAELAKMAETKEALAAVSGIKNQDILQQLVELNVRPETLAALSAVPLVEVVWADGEVDEEERKVVLDFATAQGIVAGSVARELLGSWLAQRPPATLLAAWQHYVEALCARLAPDDRQVLKNELLRNVRAAASASGGFLGMGKISGEEKDVIAKLEASFGGT
ncbi:MAG: hypothetical protein JXP73_03730 [Deltaproteobacteria bacterium]|nr:hypothetical protein [Deltaproteobacteria bacterium]